MIIEAAELHHISMPLQRPFETSFGVEQDRHCVVIRLQAEGISGWGECVAGRFPGYSYETAITAWHIMQDFLLPSLAGRPIDHAADHPRLTAAVSGHSMAKAGIELALWDLQARASDRSLGQMLGVDRAEVPVGVSVGIQPDLDALLALVQRHVDSGYPRVKLKIKPGLDLEPLRAVRAAFPDLPLQVDANAAYPAGQQEIFESLDKLNLVLIEQPYAKGELLAHAELQSRINTPVCLDESIGSVSDAQQALDLGACQIINIKPGRVGGLSEAIAIHDWCFARKVPVWCGGMLETGLGRAANLVLAGLPGFALPGDISATERYYATDIAKPRFELNQNGTITVPRGPGLGVEVELEALERVTLRKQRVEMGVA